MTANFFHIDDLSQGLPRELADGVTTRIFPGEQAMLSVVRLEANAKGSLHSHPEEQSKEQPHAFKMVNISLLRRAHSGARHLMWNTALSPGLKGVLFWMYLHHRVKNTKQPAAVLAQTPIKPV